MSNYGEIPILWRHDQREPHFYRELLSEIIGGKMMGVKNKKVGKKKKKVKAFTFPRFVFVAKTPAFGPEHTTCSFTLEGLVTIAPKIIATYVLQKSEVMATPRPRTELELAREAIGRRDKEIKMLRRALKSKKTSREKERS